MNNRQNRNCLNLSPTKQAALPEIVGNEVAYLSEAPQAVPQAAATVFSFQPAKFESAIFHYLHCDLFGTFPVP